MVKIGDARNAPAVDETDETSSATSSAKPRTPGSDVRVVPLDAKAREPAAPTVIPLPPDAEPREEAPAVVTMTEREKAEAAAGKKTRVRGAPDAAETKPRSSETKPRGETKPRSSPEKKKKKKPAPTTSDKVSEARARANQRSSGGGGRKAGERQARQVSAQARKP